MLEEFRVYLEYFARRTVCLSGVIGRNVYLQHYNCDIIPSAGAQSLRNQLGCLMPDITAREDMRNLFVPQHIGQSIAA